MGSNIYIGEASGKIILFGEHSVVYGYEALAAGLKQGCVVHLEPYSVRPGMQLSLSFSGARLDPILVKEQIKKAMHTILHAYGCISLESTASWKVCFDLPLGAGLGSSAALSVSLSRAVQQYALASKIYSTSDIDGDVFRTALVVEKLFHGNPSGLDIACAQQRSMGLFTRADGWTALSHVFPNATDKLHRNPIRFLVADTGHRRFTSAMVEQVAQLREREPEKVEFVLRKMGELARQGTRAIMENNLVQLGAHMNQNQIFLQQLGVSTPFIDELIMQVQNEGALGAKITGAGGGGCVLILAPGREEKIQNILETEGKNTFLVDAG